MACVTQVEKLSIGQAALLLLSKLLHQCKHMFFFRARQVQTKLAGLDAQRNAPRMLAHHNLAFKPHSRWSVRFVKKGLFDNAVHMDARFYRKDIRAQHGLVVRYV